MKVRKIAGHEQAAVCVWYYDDGSVVLVSYTTPVCRIDGNGWLTCNGLYSRTTIKHIGWFMRLYNMNYYTAKQAYMDNKEYNIYTGEYRDRA